MKQVTVHNLNESTDQEVFDFIVNHLRTQGQKAIAPNNNCKYRIDRLKCAAGCLIPDEDYKPAFEGFRWAQVSHAFTQAHLELIGALQNVHDNYPVDSWEEGFETVARNSNLTFTPKP